MRLFGVASLLVALTLQSWFGGGFIRQYEYEEEIFLDLDGSATVIVNASIPTLVALHGFDLPLDARARLDRNAVRALFDSPVARVTRVSRPWRRQGRRFVQVRLAVDDIRRLPRAPAFSWSTYALDRRGDQFSYRQVVRDGAARQVGPVGWRGDELVAFRLHLPSRIVYHNSTSGEVRRGNILAWEQSLSDRLAGRPLAMDARMETQSILYRTLWLFGLAFGSAVAALGAVIWWVVRKGKGEMAA